MYRIHTPVTYYNQNVHACIFYLVRQPINSFSDVVSQENENCVFMDNHGIHAKNCLESGPAAICGRKGLKY